MIQFHQNTERFEKPAVTVRVTACAEQRGSLRCSQYRKFSSAAHSPGARFGSQHACLATASKPSGVLENGNAISSPHCSIICLKTDEFFFW
jgi:hypothetical protein